MERLLEYILMSEFDIKIIGASHESQIEAVISGLPRGFTVDLEKLRIFLALRSPSGAVWSTARKEADEPCFLSGIDGNGVLDGNPLHVVIYNHGVKPLTECDRNIVPRPGHADFAAVQKYGAKTDLRGGGRFSGRMTAPICVAGGIVLQILAAHGISIRSHIYSIAGIMDKPFNRCGEKLSDFETDKYFPVTDHSAGEQMIAAVADARAEKDSVGGIAELAVLGLPAGLGGELFEGLDGKIAGYLFGIPAVKGVDFGCGFECANLLGSQNNDEYLIKNGKTVTATNNCGGILGGITNGMPLIVRVAVKPTPSIGKPQKSVNLDTLSPVTLVIKGDNDACIVPRALPALESATAFAVYEAINNEN